MEHSKEINQSKRIQAAKTILITFPARETY